MSGIAEIVHVFASRQRRTGSGLDGYESVIGFAAQLLAHERRDQPAEVGTAARATYDDVGFDSVFVKCGFGFHTYHRLMQHDVVEH